MMWEWSPIKACDCQDVVRILNTRMPRLVNALNTERPVMMDGFPRHQGAVTDNTTDTAPADTSENDLKSLTLDRGALGTKAGYRVTAAGTCSGAAGNVTLKFYWGGMEVASYGPVSCNGDWQMEMWVWNADGTRAQQVIAFVWFGGTLRVADTSSHAVDTS